jgi:Leucine-rich repeat (LRR) protein
LYLGNNDFVGPIPLTIGQLSTIERLAFNDNRLNGTFPQHPFFSLTDLALQGNNLTGTIPELGNMTNLGKKELYMYVISTTRQAIPRNAHNYLHMLSRFTERFELSDNSFTGTIPTTVGLLSYLSVFDVSSNYLSGTIPTEIDNCLNLRMINVGYNLLLNGPLPSGIMGQMVDIDGTGIEEPQPQP